MNRPTRLHEVVGQETAKEILQIEVKAAQRQNTVVSHILFEGPSGLGKTTLARALANEVGSKFYTVIGSGTLKIKDLTGFLLQLKRGDIFFIDECHRLPAKIQEFLYGVMEDFRLDLGTAAMVSLPIQPFTLIGATTESGLLLPPFYNRFHLKILLDGYDATDILVMIVKSLNKENLKISKEAGEYLAKLCRGVPRQAENYVKWLVKYAKAHGLPVVKREHVVAATSLLGVDSQGFTKQDRAYIDFLKKQNLPVGIKTIATAIGMSVETIETIIEPFLIREGILQKTHQGRILNEVFNRTQNNIRLLAESLRTG